MAMACIDYVKEFYPFGIEPSWEAMIEIWCGTGAPSWVVAVASLRMMLRTGPRASEKMTSNDKRRWKKFTMVLTKGKVVEAEKQAKQLCAGGSFDLDRWIELLSKLPKIYPQYDESFLAELFDAFACLIITDANQLDAFVAAYVKEHKIRIPSP